MKKIFVVLICLLSIKAAVAQKDLLSFDEHNKYIYYQVVDQPNLPADTLQNRALYFLKSEYPKTKIKRAETSGNITGADKFIIFSDMVIAKHPEGELSYTLYIECKDQKYRYWLTDFVFAPYKTDRYGNSVPEQGGEIPLESGLKKLDKKQLDNYLVQTGIFCKKFGDKLKQYMVKTSSLPPKEIKRKVITTKEW